LISYSPRHTNGKRGGTYYSFSSGLFGVREGQANHALMERQEKWSLIWKIKITKRIDDVCVEDFTVEAEKSHA
jgi:hypothetical protein